MIKLEQLKKTFGEKIAVDIDQFTVNEGDILGLVGNNGAGKTTLFRLILDLIKADEGQVIIDGLNPTESEEWKQWTGAYIDDSFLIDFLTPEEYFDFIGKVNNMTKEQVNDRLDAFHQFMTDEILGQKKLIRDYSAGNKQKIGIIAALLNEPKFIILDEPFNFLDPSSQIVLKRLLQNYNHEHQATILISSHNLQHTVDISTRITLLEHGHILKDLTNSEGSAEKELEDYFNI